MGSAKINWAFLKSRLSPRLRVPVILIAIFIVVVGILYKQQTSKLQKQSIPPPKEEVLKFAPPLTLSPTFNQTLQDGPYVCPVSQSLCQASSSYKNNSLMRKLAKDSSVFAAFDGELQTLASSRPNGFVEEKFTTLVLTSPERGLIGYYHFIGQTKENVKVKAGDTIATLAGQPLSAYDDNSFVFQLFKLGKTAGTLVSLQPADFK